MIAAEKTEHIKSLTGLRFFAAMMIADGHSWPLFGNNPILLGMMLNHGVSIFFVLSGFILACAYPTLAEVKSRRFFLARFARIYPLHILSAFLLLILVPTTINQFLNPGGLLTAIHFLTLTQAWFPIFQNILAYTGGAWSISAEAFFYLTFPLWIMDWGRFNLLKLPVAILPAMLLMQIANLANLPIAVTSPGFSAAGLLNFFPLARLPEFVMGVILGQFWHRYRFQFGAGLSDLTTAIAVALSLYVLSVIYPTAHSGIAKAFFGPAGYEWFLNTGGAPVYALLIFVLASSTGRISRILGSRPLVLLGEISFAMYLFHPILLRIMERHPAIIAESPQLWRLVYWTVLLLSSYVAFAYFETPIRRLITGRRSLATE